MKNRVLTWAAACAAVVAGLLGSAGAASAALVPHLRLGTVEFLHGSYVAHENQGYLTITLVRTGNLLGTEHVGYGVKQQDGRDGIDFDTIPGTYATLGPGQLLYTFNVRIIDQGINGTAVHAKAYLYGAYPAPVGQSDALITILHDDPLAPRDPVNPLGVPDTSSGNLIAGAKLYVDSDAPAAQARRQYVNSNPAWAQALGVIADEPGARRFWMWNMGSTVEGQVAHYLETTQVNQPGTTVMLSSYNLVHNGCGATSTPAVQAQYDHFMDEMAAGIGNFHVIYFLEFDSLITAGCLNPAQRAIRMAELRYAISALERDPHVVVYLDAGAADAVPAEKTANWLAQAGIHQAQGFFLNATHFDWTRTELAYGQRISQLLGGNVHFVINTGENGRGPLVPANRVAHGNEVLCNPAGRGLGPLSVSQQMAQPTGYPGADGFLWFTNPGGSGGQCVPGAPPAAHFWAAYAVMLARNWVNSVTGPLATQDSAHKSAKHRTHRKHRRRKRHH